MFYSFIINLIIASSILCNSFILHKNKWCSNFFRDYNNLRMGCDYYIDKDLHIYDYNNIIFSYINLEHERGYWYDLFDEDEDGYEERLRQYKDERLEPQMAPIIIYSNKSFNKLSLEYKYKKIIEDDLKSFNKTLNDVSKIIKIENRYER